MQIRREGARHHVGRRGPRLPASRSRAGAGQGVGSVGRRAGDSGARTKEDERDCRFYRWPSMEGTALPCTRQTLRRLGRCVQHLSIRPLRPPPPSRLLLNSTSLGTTAATTIEMGSGAAPAARVPGPPQPRALQARGGSAMALEAAEEALNYCASMELLNKGPMHCTSRFSPESFSAPGARPSTAPAWPRRGLDPAWLRWFLTNARVQHGQRPSTSTAAALRASRHRQPFVIGVGCRGRPSPQHWLRLGHFSHLLLLPAL